MNKIKMSFGISLFAITSLVLMSADHADAPGITGNVSDITDVYAFEGQDANNMVFVVNTQGLLSPSASQTAVFNENVMLEINIDNNGDNVEDLVIQAIKRRDKMYFFGTIAPDATGVNSTIKTSSESGNVEISKYGQSPTTSTSTSGMKFFAGPRDDPFFFDLGQFKSILAGTATGFNAIGTDAFAGTNVLSTVVEVPKSMLGSSATINVWAETKKK
jgi:hypothetical protein